MTLVKTLLLILHSFKPVFTITLETAKIKSGVTVESGVTVKSGVIVTSGVTVKSGVTVVWCYGKVWCYCIVSYVPSAGLNCTSTCTNKRNRHKDLSFLKKFQILLHLFLNDEDLTIHLAGITDLLFTHITVIQFKRT